MAYRNILVPIDLAEIELARPALAAALDLARASGGRVRLLHVLPLTPVMLAEYVPADFDLQQTKTAEDTLAALGREYSTQGVPLTTVVRQGGVYNEILDEAKEAGADLIAMCSHRSAVRRYFMGSNAGYVVRYAHCSVIVVRQNPPPGAA